MNEFEAILTERCNGQEQLGRQLEKVTQQLDTVVDRLSEIQVNLSSLAVRYEYIVANMERDQKTVKESLDSVDTEISDLNQRVNNIEKFYYKFSGALLVVLFIGQLVIKYFNI